MTKLTELITPKKTVPTTFEFTDIAGIVKGASKGEGLGNKFLANIREVDAIVHVVRAFDDENVMREQGREAVSYTHLCKSTVLSIVSIGINEAPYITY